MWFWASQKKTPLSQTNQTNLFKFHMRLNMLEVAWSLQRQIPSSPYLVFLRAYYVLSPVWSASQALFPVFPQILQTEVPHSSFTNGAQRGHWPAQSHTARNGSSRLWSLRTPTQCLEIFLIYAGGAAWFSVPKYALNYGGNYVLGILSRELWQMLSQSFL